MIIADMKTVTGIYNGKVPIKEVRFGERLVWKKDNGHTGKYDREVEYLLARDADTYIVTDLKIQDLTRYDIEIKGWCGLGATMLFGSRDSSVSTNSNQVSMLHSSNGNYAFRIMDGSNAVNLPANDTDVHTFKWNGADCTMTMDNKTYAISSSNKTKARQIDSNNYLALFGCNSGFVDNMGKDRCIYYFKVFEDGKLIMDYVSVIDNNGIPCFYDKVTEKLIRCGGTGTFSFAEKEVKG